MEQMMAIRNNANITSVCERPFLPSTPKENEIS
jgi:hypothetical protein